MKKKNHIILMFLAFYASFNCFGQVGINTTTPLSTLDINGNLSVKVIYLTGSNSGGSGTAVKINDGVYISLTPLQTNDKFELPNPTLVPGRMYVIRNISNNITAQLTTTANLLFPKNKTVGSASIYMYEDNLRTITVFSDGLNWTYIN